MDPDKRLRQDHPREENFACWESVNERAADCEQWKHCCRHVDCGNRSSKRESGREDGECRGSGPHDLLDLLRFNEPPLFSSWTVLAVRDSVALVQRSLCHPCRLCRYRRRNENLSPIVRTVAQPFVGRHLCPVLPSMLGRVPADTRIPRYGFQRPGSAVALSLRSSMLP